MSTAVNICVLACQNASWVNTLKQRSAGKERFRSGSINRHRRRAGELEKSMLMLAGIDVGPRDFQTRIDVPNYCRKTVWDVIRLQRAVLDDVAVLVVWDYAHVYIEPGDYATVRGGASVHGVWIRLIRIGDGAPSGHDARVVVRVAAADPRRREHRTHRVVVVQAAIDAAIRSDGTWYSARVTWEQHCCECAMAMQKALYAGR